MPSPIDCILEKVEWRCTKCEQLMSEQCHCWDRILPGEKQALAAEVRRRFRQDLRTSVPQIWANKSARESLPNHLHNIVTGYIQRLVHDAPSSHRGLRPNEMDALVAECRSHCGWYMDWQYPALWALLETSQQATCLALVEVALWEALATFTVAG